MEYRFLGRSGLRVSVLSFGTMTFGGGEHFEHVGNVQTEEARRLVDICIDKGVNLFDTADMYSAGRSEEILGTAIGKERRHQVVISTKAFFRNDEGPNNVGSSRLHLIDACEKSLRRLNTDYIDIYHLHNFDSYTPLEETLQTLDQLIRQGKVRYIACSNFSGWHLMKALAIADQKGYQRFIAHQSNYSLLARELEYELIPLGIDQGVDALVWSPLSFGLLSGKYSRKSNKPEHTRLDALDPPGTIDWSHLYKIVDALTKIATKRNVSVAQVALNWLVQRPGIGSVIIGARNETQLQENLKSVDWHLTDSEMKTLEKISRVPEIYPYWHQHKFGSERNPMLDN
jgi:aryl-alcohol dehydrogenase-like predicted oxidoreductase